MVDATTDAGLALVLMAGGRVELHPAMVWLEVVLAAAAAVQLVPGNGARPSLTSQEGMATLLYAAAVGCTVRVAVVLSVVLLRGGGDSVRRRGRDDRAATRRGLAMLLRLLWTCKRMCLPRRPSTCAVRWQW